MNERETAGPMPAAERIERFLSGGHIAAAGARIVPLTGDASDRSYFRVLSPDGRSVVLALHAGPMDFRSLPFAIVARLLSAMPLPIPAILADSDELGILALEDLGDVTLQAHLGAGTVVQHAALDREAVSLIEQLQRRGGELATGGAQPYTIAFDIEKLTWELNFFVKHFLEGYRGAILTDGERNALDGQWLAIASDLAAEPRVLCHRDYHSRNLMLHDDRLHIIDFQDARMGPDTYDLASLLRDSYVDITDPDLDQLIVYFLALKGMTDLEAFRARFDLMSVQRNLKALGTFGNQAIARRNPVYIQYIPRTLRYLRMNLHKHGRFGRLREVLADHLEEVS